MSKQFLIGWMMAALCAGSALAAEDAYAPQVSDGEGVKVTVTLQNIPSGAKAWNFEVVMETHTHSLSDEMNEASVLIADGKRYLPLGWDGAPPGGHHRKGILRFMAIVPQPASVELQLALTGDPKPRSFKWRLK